MAAPSLRPQHPASERERRTRRVAEATFAFSLLPCLFAVLMVALLTPFWEHTRVLVGCLLVGGVGWALAIALARGGGMSLRVVVAGALALRLVAYAGAPDLSDDLYRYVWEGEVLANGASPYALAPDAPELAELRAARPELAALVGHPDVPAAYPPLIQGVGGLFARLCGALDLGWRGTARALRAFFALCDLLVLWPLVLLLRRSGLPDALAVAWGWSPLAAVEFASSGHLDSLAILLLLGGLAALAPIAQGARRLVPGARELGGVALLAGAVLAKYLPLCALPFALRGPRGWSRALLGLLLVALAFAPFAVLGGGVGGLFGGLSEYGLRWESGAILHGPIQWVFDHGFARDLSWTDPRRLARAAELALWIWLGLKLWVDGRDVLTATGALVMGFLVLSPTLHPWYFTWLLPFVALRLRASALWLCFTAPLWYEGLNAWKTRGEWTGPLAYWVLAVPVLAILLAYEAWSGHAAKRAA